MEIGLNKNQKLNVLPHLSQLAPDYYSAGVPA